MSEEIRDEAAEHKVRVQTLKVLAATFVLPVAITLLCAYYFLAIK